MTDATTAAKAIQDRHSPPNREIPGIAEDVRDAGVVLARLNEAIVHLEAIRNTLQRHSGDGSNSNYNHAVAALACLDD